MRWGELSINQSLSINHLMMSVIVIVSNHNECCNFLNIQVGLMTMLETNAWSRWAHRAPLRPNDNLLFIWEARRARDRRSDSRLAQSPPGPATLQPGGFCNRKAT
jgi:hypothetical protein